MTKLEYSDAHSEIRAMTDLVLQIAKKASFEETEKTVVSKYTLKMIS